MEEPNTLWILLDVSNSMRGAMIESARNVLQQYVLGPLLGGNTRISLITFSNAAASVTESPAGTAEFVLPADFQIGGMCNLSDAVRLCTSKCSHGDRILVVTRGLTTDSYGDKVERCGCESHVLLLDSVSARIPVNLNAYFSGRLTVHNMKGESLDQLTRELVSQQQMKDNK